MLRDVVFASVILTVAYGSAFAADKSSGDSKTARGGLACLSVDGQHGQTCDVLCAKAEMACTGTMSAHGSPPLGCGNVIDDTIAPFPVCRCCAVERR